MPLADTQAQPSGATAISVGAESAPGNGCSMYLTRITDFLKAAHPTGIPFREPHITQCDIQARKPAVEGPHRVPFEIRRRRRVDTADAVRAGSVNQAQILRSILISCGLVPRPVGKNPKARPGSLPGRQGELPDHRLAGRGEPDILTRCRRNALHLSAGPRQRKLGELAGASRGNRQLPQLVSGLLAKPDLDRIPGQDGQPGGFAGRRRDRILCPCPCDRIKAGDLVTGYSLTQIEPAADTIS